jgi:hypothetical protein
VFIQEEISSVYSDEEMNSAYSGKKWIKIVYIQGRNEWCLFREEMNSVYSWKKWIVLIKGTIVLT